MGIIFKKLIESIWSVFANSSTEELASGPSQCLFTHANLKFSVPLFQLVVGGSFCAVNQILVQSKSVSVLSHAPFHVDLQSRHIFNPVCIPQPGLPSG